MLQTLLKIGKWQSQNRSQWDRFLDFPLPEAKDKRGNSITNYTLPIIFDLDTKEVIISSENLREYDEKDVAQTFPLKIKGGNNKAIYTSVPANKLNQIYKTFFGKEGTEGGCGELKEAVLNFDQELLSKDFESILDQIFELKEKFLEKTVPLEKKNVDAKAIETEFRLNSNERLVFLAVYLKSEKFGFNEKTLFSSIPDYNTFIQRLYFGSKSESEKSDSSPMKLCYASGEISDDVEELNLSTRYSLNKMFVTETKNYATSFEENKLYRNYQVSAKNQEYLDYASAYLLNQGYKVRIANIDHVIIPEFLQDSKIDLEMALVGVQKRSDLLFNLTRLDYFRKSVEDEIEEDEPYWINFIAFESDGNFFKSTEVIKDVSHFYFRKLIDEFYAIDRQFSDSGFTHWDAVMTSYDFEAKDRKRHYLNFNSLYGVVPIRKDKEKKNKALDLFKTILENRKVDKAILYDHFTELILCHFYERYNSYTNIPKYGNDYFHTAVRDSVFKYLAFFQLLNNLKLIDMKTASQEKNAANEYDKAEQDFIQSMNLGQPQQAMFFLGRTLNKVEQIQIRKKIKKTVIHLVNFNGLDENGILRLRNDLVNKARQHNKVAEVKFMDGKFGEQFDYNNWSMDPKEALFFLLTGYSFRFTKEETKKQEEVEETEDSQ